MRSLRRLLSTLIVLTLALPACSTFSSKPKSDPGVLRVGINTGYPPLGFEQGGKVQGIEAEFAAMLGKELGREVRFVPLPLKDLIPALDDGRIDIIMAGMSVTQARSEKAAFVEPYARIGQMALIRQEDFGKLRSVSALNWPTSRVGVKAQTTGAKFARQSLGAAKVTEFKTVDEGVAALRAGKVDFFIHDAPTVWRVAGTPLNPDPELIGLYEPLTEEYLAWAVPKDEAQFRQELSDIVIKWKTDGQIKAVLDKWVPVRRVAKDAGETPPQKRP
jgi:polar amino acid transport system substrate-binding protein